MKLRALATWMDGYGLAGALTDQRYQDPIVIKESALHINDVVGNFMAHLTQDEVYHGGQERGFAWGAVRTPEELVNDPHLQDRKFWVEVEHPELGRRFTYPGAPALYNKAPWNISRRAPLVGEHNEEIYCTELGLTWEELASLAEAGAV